MVKLWDYNDAGECVVKNVRALPQPLVHMLANGPQYFAISDNYLRGFSGFDYTRMFGEFDGQNFPKNNGRFLWVRPAGENPWRHGFHEPRHRLYSSGVECARQSRCGGQRVSRSRAQKRVWPD